jgi:hypothetical protein
MGGYSINEGGTEASPFTHTHTHIHIHTHTHTHTHTLRGVAVCRHKFSKVTALE